MNHIQRQLIKEAYQEGYYQALEENLGKRIGNYLGKKVGGLLKNLFRSKKVDDDLKDNSSKRHIKRVTTRTLGS